MNNTRFYHLFIIPLMLLFVLPMKAQIFPHSPKRETRAVWVTTIMGLDWPRAKATDEIGKNRQKEELRQLLDKLKEAGINTILLQTRIRGTVIYPSKIETWDACLTGTQGVSPGYDPLAFAVEECHRRGMQIHAWVVTLKVANNKYLNPANTETGRLLSDICCEIAQNYDIDGISLDYIRYPEIASTINDKQQYKKNTRGLSYPDWRRDNITQIVRKVYCDVKTIKPWLWVTSSPVGKYSDTACYTAGGWNAYNRVYQDVERWMREGIHDGLFPMMYFRDDNFYPFALQWAEMAETAELSKNTVCPGLGIYFMSQKEKDWPLSDITRELEFMRREGMGQCYFRARFLTDNTKGIFDWLRLYHNREHVLPAPLPRSGTEETPPVDSLTFILHTADSATAIIHSTAKTHNVYLITPDDTTLLLPMMQNKTFYFSPRMLITKNAKIGVKSMSKYGNEGKMTEKSLNSYTYIVRELEKRRTFARKLGNSLIF